VTIEIRCSLSDAALHGMIFDKIRV